MDLIKTLANILDGSPRNDGPPVIENMARNPHSRVEPVGILHTPIDPATGQPKVTTLPAKPKLELDGVPHPVEGQLAAVGKLVAERGKVRVSAEDLKLFGELLAKEKRLTELAFNHRPDAARQAWQQSVTDTANRVAAGEDVTASDSFTLEDYREDFKIKAGVFREQRREVESQIRALTAKYLPAYADEVDRMADDEETVLRKAFARYGVGYRPAPYVWMLRKLAHLAREGNATVLPKSFFTK